LQFKDGGESLPARERQKFVLAVLPLAEDAPTPLKKAVLFSLTPRFSGVFVGIVVVATVSTVSRARRKPLKRFVGLVRFATPC
jgi:hypothetical protein